MTAALMNNIIFHRLFFVNQKSQKYCVFF